MSKAITSKFPIWGLPGRAAAWIVPISGSNTQLQYGKFADLDLETLRPARDPLGPVLVGTVDGALRGQVRVRDSFRHIDVRSKMHAGELLALNLQTPWATDYAGATEAVRPMAHPGCYRVESVRAQRLRAFYLESEGAPWLHWRHLKVDRATRAEIADSVWDMAIDHMTKPIPSRYKSIRNPWVWLFGLVAYE